MIHLSPFIGRPAAERPVLMASLGRSLSLALATTLKGLARAAGLVAEWRARSRSRRELMALDDRLLQDIGLGRGDAYMEYSKPFWRK